MKRKLSRRLRILFGSHIGFPVGGISKNYEAILNSELKNQADLFFVETSKSNLRFSQRGLLNFTNIWFAFENIFRFTKSLLKIKPDIVHLGTAKGNSLLKHSLMAVISKLFGFTTIIQFHFSITKIDFKNVVYKLIIWMLSFSDGCIILSSEWWRFQVFIPSTKIVLIPNAISTDYYDDLEKYKSEPQGNVVKLLYLGHLGEDKGTFDLIESIRVLLNTKIDKFQLFMYGDSLEPGDKEKILSLIKKYEIDDYIKIGDLIVGEKKKQVLANSDIYLLPSHHEGMPISIIEAMASSLPIIATNVGGISEQVVHDLNGLIIRPNNVKELSSAIQKLVCNKSMRVSMGKESKNRAKNLFDISVKVDKLLTFYNELYYGESDD